MKRRNLIVMRYDHYQRNVRLFEKAGRVVGGLVAFGIIWMMGILMMGVR